MKGQTGMRALFIIIIIGLWANGAWAQAARNIPRTCNPEFYDIMNARAWMGGARDMQAAQTLIRGGRDNLSYSVLSLTCFGSRANIPGYSGMYIGTLITPVEASYLSNFSGSTCSSMKALWDLSKCADTQGANFLTLKDLVTQDTRGCGAISPKWNAAYQLTNPPYGQTQSADTTLTYLDRLTAKNGCAALGAVPTGIRVTSDVNPDYSDAICPAPQCAHDGQGKCQ